MTDDLDAFVAEYFRIERALRDDAPRSERLWNEETVDTNAWGQVQDLLRTAPGEAWRRILVLIDQAPDDDALGFVAADALEDFVDEHGTSFHAEIALEARTNAKLRKALNGVWRWHTFPVDVRAALMPVLDPDVRAYWDARAASEPTPKQPWRTRKPRSCDIRER
jgi:hypothetical protein